MKQVYSKKEETNRKLLHEHEIVVLIAVLIVGILIGRYVFAGSPKGSKAIECMDGIDNDGDNMVDYPADPGCSSKRDTSELSNIQCDDGIDNDGDTKRDYPSDTGCTSLTDTSERGTLACDDGVDNDGDGKVDMNDLGCISLTDNDETNCGDLVCGGGETYTTCPSDCPAPPACADGVDNDADTFIDYPNDAGCKSPSDPDETANIVWNTVLVDSVSSGYIGSASTKALGNYVFIAYSTGSKYNSSWDYALKFAKSTDGGKTFSIISIIQGSAIIHDLYALSSNVLVISYFSNYTYKFAKSTDGGKTWSVSNIDFIGYGVSGRSSIYATDENTIFVAYDGGDYDLKFAKSTDGGLTWTTKVIETKPPSGYLGRYPSLHAVDANIIFVGYDYNFQTLEDIFWEARLAKSTDGGNTWQIIQVDKDTDAGAGATSIDALDSNTIYMAYRGDRGHGLKIAKSTDGGNVWNVQNLSKQDDYEYFTSLDAFDANTIFIASLDSLSPSNLNYFESRDGASSWTTQTLVSGDYKVQYASLSAVSNNQVYIGFANYSGGLLLESNIS